MKKINKALIIICISLFINCKKNDEKVQLLKFDISTSHQTELSAIAENIIEIKLDSNILIKTIMQVEVLEDFILIRDIEIGVLVFNKKGNFIRTIGNKGEGPGEYTYCTGFVLDMPNKEVMLQTNIGVLTYDLLGNFIKRVPNRFTFFYYDNNSFYIIEDKHSNSQNIYYQDTHLSIYDKNWNCITSILRKRYESPDLRVRSSTNGKAIFKEGENIFLFLTDHSINSKQDTIFKVNGTELSPFKVIKLTNANNDEDLKSVFISGRYTVVTYLTLFKHGNTEFNNHYKSQHVYDDKNKTYMHSRKGFIDDIHNNENVIIMPLIHEGMFYYTQEKDYSDELKMEPNPTLYIGTFKK